MTIAFLRVLPKTLIVKCAKHWKSWFNKQQPTHVDLADDYKFDSKCTRTSFLAYSVPNKKQRFQG